MRVEYEVAAMGLTKREHSMTADVRAALDQVRAGAKCSQCSNRASVYTMRRLFCRACADVECAFRSVDTTHRRHVLHDNR